MTFSLTVDGPAFEKHLTAILTEYKKSGADVIPVIKGNGYGFTRRLLAKQAQKLNLNRISVGTIYELDQALTDFGNEIIVLEPFNPTDTQTIQHWEHALLNNAHRVIAVIAGPYFAEASRVGIKRAFVEGKTSTTRFGVSISELPQIINSDHHNVEIVGLNLHLPIAEPNQVNFALLEGSAKLNSRKTSNRIIEVANWLSSYVSLASEHQLPIHLSVSHVTSKDAAQIVEIAKERNQHLSVEVRLGTSFWLGNQKLLKVAGTVLEIHELTEDHQHIGYRQIDSHGNARLLIVSGGTSHGVALAAPVNRTSLRAKSVALAEGISEALGKIRSPFKLNGKNLPFAEPPHMHVSLLWCNDPKVKVGDQLECTVRNTTSNFDVIHGL